MMNYAKFLATLLCGISFLLTSNGQENSLRIGLPLGHAGSVSSAEFSPDGKYVVTSGIDKSAKIWDRETGKLLRSIAFPKGASKAQFSIDGNFIILRSSRKIYICDSKSGQVRDSITGLPLNFTFQVSPKGKYLLTITSNANDLKVWDYTNGTLVQNLKGNTDAIMDAQFSSDGELTATASSDNMVKIWKWKTGELVATMRGHTNEVASMQFSPDGSLLLTGSKDNTLRIWDCQSGALLQTVENYTYNYLGTKKPQFSPACAEDSLGGQFFSAVVSDSYGVHVKIWETSSGKLISSTDDTFIVLFSPTELLMFSANRYKGIYLLGLNKAKKLKVPDRFSLFPINEVAFSPDGNYVLGIYDDDVKRKSYVLIWDVKSGQLISILEGHTNFIASAEFSPETLNDTLGGKYFVTASWDKTARVWEGATGKLVQSLVGNKGFVRSATFSTDGKNVLTGSLDSTARIWDWKNGSIMQTLRPDTTDVVWAFYSPNSEYVFTTGISSYASQQWNSSTGQKQLFDYNENVFGMSQDGQKIISSRYNELFIRDAKSGELLKSIYGSPENPNGHTGSISYAQFIPAHFSDSLNSSLVITASYDFTAKIWDYETGLLKHTLKGHNSRIESLQVSSDGRYAVTASLDNTAKIWSIVTGELIHTLKGHSSWLGFAQFSPNGHYVITASADGSVILWDAKTGSLLLQQFILDSAETVTLHPSGLFDASEGAMKLMYWVKNNEEVIDFAQLKDRYWEPGLWEKVMKGETLRSVQGMNQLKSAPQIILGEVKDGKLPVTLTKRDGGYGKVAVYINGKEVVADARGGDVLDSTIATQELTIDIANNPLLKVGEENTVTVKAWSDDGFVEGRGAEIVYTPNGDASENPPSFYAVVCGVSEYVRGDINLKYAQPDAVAIAQALQLGAENLFGKERTHVYNLTSPGQTKPSKENIEKTFEEISKLAKPEDILILYLSGHGITWGGDFGDFYYLTYDAFSSTAEAFNDPAIRENTTISTHEFTEWIKRIPALKQVMIIDACGAGKAVDNLIAMRNVEASQIKAIDRMKDRTGMYIISGCAADAVSYEASRYGQGLLTYSLLQAMKGAALKENKFVDVTYLLNYAREQVPIMAEGIGGIQTPQMLLPTSGSFDIGILNEADQIAIPLANPKPVFVRSAFININESEDNLSLSTFVDEHLSALSARGAEAKLIFIDAKQYPESCKVGGSYYFENAKWHLKAKIKCGEKENQIVLEAANEESLKALLLKEIMAKVN